MLDKNGKESLYGCFLKAGLDRSQFRRKKITFSMAEHAMLIFDRKDSLNIEQLELVMRQIKAKMQVGELSRLEKHRVRLESKNPRKAFGRWLLCKINLQLVWNEQMNQVNENVKATGKMPFKRTKFAKRLVFEEKLWETVANIDKVSISRICRHVSKNLAILLFMREHYGEQLHHELSIKKGLREKIREIIKKEYALLDTEKELQIEEIKLNDQIKHKSH